MGPRRFVIVLAGLLSACGLIAGPASGSCAFYGSETQWHCAHDPIAGLVGTATQAGSFGEVGVRFEGDRVHRQCGYTEVEVDARTSVTGFDDNGIPHIVEGDHLRAAVRECGSGRRYKVIAVSIAALS